MKSATLPSFWTTYGSLGEDIKRQARKAYLPLVGRESLSPILALQMYQPRRKRLVVRITRRYRAVGILEGDTVTWFWIGGHDDYEHFFS